MASAKQRTVSQAASPGLTLPHRIAYYCLLATVALVPLATTLGIGRPWGFYALTEEPYHTPKLLILSLLITAATVAWLLDIATRGRALRWGPAYTALGVFSALVLVSTAASPQIATSFFGASSLLTGAFTWLACAWAGVLLAYYVTGGSQVLVLSRVTALTGTAVGVVALLQAVGADPLGTQLQEGFGWMVVQGMATTGNPNYTGALLVVPALISLALAVSEKDARWRWVAIAATAITVAALFITLTRAAWIGLAVGAVAFALLLPSAAVGERRRLARTALALLGALAAGVLLASPSAVAARFSALAKGLDAFSAGRLTLWADTGRVVAAHPLFGSGADRLGVAAYPLQADVAFEGTSRLVLQDPHSMPLLVAAIYGVPAAIAFVTLLGMAITAGVSKLRSEERVSVAGVVYAGWVAGLIGVIATSLLSVTTITLIFMLFVAVGVVLAPTLKPPVSGRMWPTWVIGVLALAVMVTGLWGTLQANRASNALVVARFQDSEANLKRAMALTPWDSRMRTEYLSRKIGAMLPTLNGDDAAAAQRMAAQIDTEIRFAQLDFPGELLLYRIRILMHEAMVDAAGYQVELHREAIDAALAAFPEDAEFKKIREEFQAAE